MTDPQLNEAVIKKLGWTHNISGERVTLYPDSEETPHGTTFDPAGKIAHAVCALTWWCNMKGGLAWRLAYEPAGFTFQYSCWTFDPDEQDENGDEVCRSYADRIQIAICREIAGGRSQGPIS